VDRGNNLAVRETAHITSSGDGVVVQFATTTASSAMVRRGSTVRVPQRALQEAPLAGIVRAERLALAPACGGYGRSMELATTELDLLSAREEAPAAGHTPTGRI
jgi:hypothetical protein